MKVKWMLFLLAALVAASTFGAASGARASAAAGESIHTAVSASGLMDAFWFKQLDLSTGSCRSPWGPRRESSDSGGTGQSITGDAPAAFVGISPNSVANDCPTIDFGGPVFGISGAHAEIVRADASEGSGSARLATRLATVDESAAPPGGDPRYLLVRTSSFASASSTIVDTITLSKPTTVALVGDVAGSRNGTGSGSANSRLRFDGFGMPFGDNGFSGQFLGDPASPSASQNFSVSVGLPAGTTSLEAAMDANGSSVALAGSDPGKDSDAGSLDLELSMHYRVYVLDSSAAADSGSGRMPILHGFPSDAPVADAAWHTTAPGTVHLDGTGSHGDGLSYAWSLFGTSLGTGPELDASLGSPPREIGVWPVKLVVTDSLGRTATMLIPVAPGSDVPPTPNDTTAPTVTCDSADAAWHATDVSIGCTASDGDSGLADPADGAFSLSTSIPSGSETADATTGSRSVCDNAGNCAQAGPIGGIRVDRKAPTLTLPAQIVVNATSPAGAAVRYAITAVDGTDPSPAVTCAPASGATIGVGTATVSCTATDHAGNTTSGSFTVKVKGASEQIGDLVDELLSMLNQPALSSALRAQLQSAAQALIQRNPRAACTTLAAFTVAVRLTPPWLLTTAQKARLIDDATRIRAVIGC